MGLFAGGIDAVAQSEMMRVSVRQWMTCPIVILNPGVNMVNFKTKNPAAFVWSGMSRYQPYRKEVATPQVTDPTTTATARFQVDFDGLPEIKTGYRVWITGATEQPDPYTGIYDHVVTQALNSSLAWIRTIETIVNTEARPNYQIIPNGTGGYQWV